MIFAINVHVISLCSIEKRIIHKLFFRIVVVIMLSLFSIRGLSMFGFIRLYDIYYTWINNLCRNLRLINVHELKSHDGAFELNEFKYTTKKHIETCKDILLGQYYKDVVDIFLLGNRKKKLPDPSNRKKMVTFYNAVAAVMTYHLQTLCLKSLYDYVEYITDVKVKLKK